MASFEINIEGINEYASSLNENAEAFKRNVKALVEVAAKDWVSKAKRSAPKDKGGSGLAGAITYYPEGETEESVGYNIVAQKTYAPYQEWGTIEHVSVPGELAEYAAQFKGRGIRKRGGIRPRSFFFIHQNTIIETLRQRIENLKKDFAK